MVVGTELFGLLREKHGDGFQQFVDDKVAALAGDIVYENLGLEAPLLDKLAKEMDVIVNIAATTNFYERYDVSLDVNVMGAPVPLRQAMYQAQDAHACLHSYVSDNKEGLILEKPIKPGETAPGRHLPRHRRRAAARQGRQEGAQAQRPRRPQQDGEEGHEGARPPKKARHFGWSNTYVFTKAMGEMLLGELLGDMPAVIMRPSIITSVMADPLPGWMQGTRTIDTLIIGYAKQNLSCFLGDLSVVPDVIPGDMVVNAMLAAMVVHSGERGAPPPVYHATSSLRNPTTYGVIYQAGQRYFYQNPRVGENGEVIPTKEMHLFTTMASLHLYMMLTYKLPLEQKPKYDDEFVMRFADVYAPFAFFKGCYDDMNLERLRLKMAMKTPEDRMFNFDPKTIDWEEYFYRIHIPGVLKYVCK
ncbi:hypothetical protein ACP70R_001382 [Stipagrostis hirtigluma subsp. patula]